MLNISGYGSAGPRKDRKAYDMLVQAESGMVAVTGTPETATKTGVPTADIAAGLYAAMSVLGALFRRERTGQGAVIDVSMFDAAVEWMGHPLYMQLYGGRQIPRMGLSHAAIAPYDAYPTADGQILIGVQNDRGWRTLVTEVFGRPEYADDPRFATNVNRVAHRDECDAVVAECTNVLVDGEAGRAAGRGGHPGRSDQLDGGRARASAAGRAGPLANGRDRGRRDPRRAAADDLPRRRAADGPGPGPRRTQRRDPRRAAAPRRRAAAPAVRTKEASDVR